MALEKSEALYLKTRERVHFSNPLSSTEESQIESDISRSSLLGLGPPSALKSAVDKPLTHGSILKFNQNSVTRVNHASADSSDLPPMNWGTRTLHSAANIHLIPASTEFLETPYGLAIRSPAHNNSIAYLNKGHCVIRRPDALSGLSELSEKPYEFQDWKQPAATSGNIWKFNSTGANLLAPLGAVMDTGAQRGATGCRAEILKNTGHTLSMQPAVGPSKSMKGILMGTETVDQHGKHYILVIPDISVFDPNMSDSLVSAGRLMEADYNVIFRLPSKAATDGFSSKQFPLYGGTVTSPDGSTVIVMEYVSHTWRLPKPGGAHTHLTKPQSLPSLENPSLSLNILDEEPLAENIEVRVSHENSFSALGDDFDNSDEAYVPEFLSQERVAGRLQQRFEVMCKHRQEAMNAHRGNGHPNNRQLLLNMEAAGVPYKHLKRYILALNCDSCAAATGRRHNKVSTVRVEAAQAKRRLKAQRKLAAQQKATSKQTDTVELEISPITDAQNPKMTITESLARFF